MKSLTKVVSSARRDRDLEARVRPYLPTRATAYVFLEAESTMEMAHQLAEAGAPHGTFVLAVQQTQGKGRLGRTWNSPKGGLYGSIILKPTRPDTELPQLSLIAGLAVAEAIRELTGLLPSIRWPNDLLIGSLKVAGILIERRDGVVVGIGVNVTTRLKELPKEATTLAAQGAECELYQLAGLVHQRLMAWYDEWSESGFAKIRETLHPWMAGFGQPVRISAGSEEFEGTASDLDESGRLVVRLDSGVLKTFDAGEVTLLH